MRNVRIPDVRRETLEAIIKKNRENVLEPSDVLAQLLIDYIKKYSVQANDSASNRETEHVRQAKQMLGILSPQKYSAHLTLFQTSRHSREQKKQTQHQTFEHRENVDNVPYFIGQLNLYWKNRLIYPELKHLLSAFFSVYEQYNSRLSDESHQKLNIQDAWNDTIVNGIESILNEINHFDQNRQLLAMQALGQFHDWIPMQKCNDVVKSLLDCLYQSIYFFGKNVMREALFPTIIKLKEWIPVEKRTEVMEQILRFLHTTDDALIVPVCEAVVTLKEWLNEEILDIHIKLLLTKVNRPTNEIEQQRVCMKLGKLMPVIPPDKQGEVLQALLNSLNHNAPSVRENALIALGQARDIIPSMLLSQVEENVYKKISDNFPVCVAACEALGHLKNLISVEKIPRIGNKLHRVLCDKKNHLAVRMAAAHAFAQLHTHLPEQMQLDLAADLHGMAINVHEQSALRAACIQAFAHYSHLLAPEKVKQLVSLLESKISIKIKMAMVEALNQFYIKIPNEDKFNALKNLLVMIWNDSEPLKIRLAAGDALYKLNQDLLDSSALKIISKVNDDTPSIRSKTYNLLIKLKPLISTQMCTETINRLIQKLNEEDNDKAIKNLYATIYEYRDKMSYSQKISVMMRLPLLIRQENIGEHQAKILLNQMYSSYQEDLSRMMLMSVPAESGYHLPVEIICNVLSYK